MIFTLRGELAVSLIKEIFFTTFLMISIVLLDGCADMKTPSAPIFITGL